MASLQALTPETAALSTRLSRLVLLAAADVQALHQAERDRRCISARQEIVGEAQPIRERRALLSGWACRQRILMDGQRQILSFLLPGDLIGVCHHRNPLAATTIVGVTEMVMCVAPPAEEGSSLAEAYARSAALEERYLVAQITRLGRLNAYERLADWLLETRERLAMVGLSGGDRFALPITQEMLADALGLTSVHVNRTLQAMRRDGLLKLQGGMITLLDRDRLERLVDHKPTRISSDD